MVPDVAAPVMGTPDEAWERDRAGSIHDSIMMGCAVGPAVAGSGWGAGDGASGPDGPQDAIARARFRRQYRTYRGRRASFSARPGARPVLACGARD